MYGWIKLHRSIKKHWLYNSKEPFTQLEAWVDILLEVNHSEHKINLKNELLVCNAGESLNSLETWGERWKWNKSKVRRFLKLLESDSMVVTKSERKTTRLTVCNYATYQVERNADETQTKRKRNANETQVTPNKNDKKEKNDNNDKKLYPDTCLTFEQFWDLYDKKVGDRKTIERKWNNVKEEYRVIAKEHIPLCKISQPNKKYRSNPSTYINGELWNNEIISNRQQTPQDQARAREFKEPEIDIASLMLN